MQAVIDGSKVFTGDKEEKEEVIMKEREKRLQNELVPRSFLRIPKVLMPARVCTISATTPTPWK